MAMGVNAGLIMGKIVTRLRLSLFPTARDKEARRWRSDGGDEALRYDYDLSADSLVMDLGGYRGQWASDIYSRYCCRVLVVEPVPSFAEAIEKRFKKNGNVKVFRLALGTNKRRATIAVGEDGSSLFRDASAREPIQFEDAVEFFRKHDIHSVDLMKVNIEGGEYELMPRLFEAGLVTRIRHIQIQFHDVEPNSERRMEEICRELSRTHRPTYRYKFIWENWVRCDV